MFGLTGITFSIVRFELNFLPSYDDAALLDELRRVASLIDTPKLSRRQFKQFSKVHSSTLCKRFGSWNAALSAAGLADRFIDDFAPYNRDELIAEIRRIGEQIGTGELTLNEFSVYSGITGRPVRRIFGTWKAAIAEAGFGQSALGRRYTDEQCFENLLAHWTHFGKMPQHDEANLPPSTVGAKAYTRRWGTWRKALAAFVSRVSDDRNELDQETPIKQSHDYVDTSTAAQPELS